jgi:hypothetical protein
MDRKHLTEQLEKDYQLLKALENSRRVADDPKYKEKLRLDIEELKQTIDQREFELNLSGDQNPVEEVNVVQPRKNSQDFLRLSEIEIQSLESEDIKVFLSLTDLAGFCAYSFPLMRWMYEPVPAEHVGWYFSKIQEFFMFNGRHIPASLGRLVGETEYFFRCAYRLPSFDFQSTLSEIDNYVASKLEGAYKGFMMIFTNFGYEDHLSGISLRNLSLLSVLIKLREGLSFLLKEASYKEKNISPSDAEQDIIRLLIYITAFSSLVERI